MRKLLVLAALLALAPIAQAQTRIEVSTLAGYAFFTGSTDVGPNVSIDTGSGPAGGLFVGVRSGKLKVEAGAMALRGEGALKFFGEESLSLGHLDLVPLMLVASFHPLTDRFDPYVGVGGAYVIGQNLRSKDLDTAGIGVLDVDSKAAVVGNVGCGYRLSESVQIVIDGRYIPVELNSVPKNGTVAQKIKMNPIVLTGGFVFRF